MELIPYEKFTKLRLREFEPSATDSRESAGSACFEFLDLHWHDESARGFLCHEKEPQRLGGVCLDFRCMESKLILPILSALQLPLHPNMTSGVVSGILGTPTASPNATLGYAVYDFACGLKDRYQVRCYFTHCQGLHGVDILCGDLLTDSDWRKDPGAPPNPGAATPLGNAGATESHHR